MRLPSRPRAEEVERSIHKSLAPYRSPAGHRGDGHREWFRGAIADRAVRLLSQMPLDDTTLRTARLVPFNLPPPPTSAVSVETGPQDTWWRVEDLLLRLGLQFAVTVAGGDCPHVTVHGFRGLDTQRAGHLRSAALDADSYQCWRDGRPLSFVQFIRTEGDDLVLEFKPLHVFERWEGGLDLAWQVKGFLARLRRVARIRRG